MAKKLFDEIPFLEGERVVVKALTAADAAGLEALRTSPRVNRYLPTFLFEKQAADAQAVIDHLYGELFSGKESLILGIYQKETGEFCGLGELYHYDEETHTVSIGGRILEKFWKKGLVNEAARLVVAWLQEETDIEILTASTMVENDNSAAALTRLGFVRTAENVPEDWGFESPVQVHQWAIRIRE